ncbi:Serine/threonine-protein phosphatase 4 regulatory subunit 2 [Habropoda laboriosa]|uniref:Serine/threonine-protein phosphatase 4 regulatory subunit 2 n=1 Tax=Habropoda laboriosa TaxID=597456 RepID=A0A0L7QUC2_9HYME|nr:PREDICTED: serine/threonine-protein phosphatase 4 regulatory subunit 2 [Habropoda laboriosa]KOC62257.1 Serine/threonine-protein phosphatase 4 regulatory subunit 2 [Habropoda laboriosa]
MENLEEVLQALDEFQKMRPSEIPRELEDYLCWVAKTGDPVYQWPLIKTLFREKLTRVMTDFYESCPTLELAPCPNVEHFNYDTMKSNLLERLESFANAPFTVQRICELLTAPRKEYNRVDKFMRAIEKNILVVSTREPGPIARRNENGDGMVNGSVDEDTSVTQPPQDVEMEYWEKDCPSTVTISVHTVESETPLLHTVVPTTTVVKSVFGTEELSHEKVESTSSKSDIVVSNFIPSTSEFSGVSNLNSQAQTHDSQIGSTIQNLSTIVPEASGIVSDVSEAIMNEDTSSQPSLELENEGGDTIDSSRKLQTTFQTKDFSNENKSSKFYVDNSKINEKTEIGATPIHMQGGLSKTNDILVKSDVESKTEMNNKESLNPIVENLLNTSNETLEDTIKSNTDVENTQPIINTAGSNVDHKESLPLESVSIENTSITNKSEQSTNNLILSTDNTSIEETSNTSEEMSVDVVNLKDQNKETELTEDLKPIVEEPCSNNNATENFNCGQEKNNLTITEAVEDETRVLKSIVPDPIPIIEEPKDIESANTKAEDTSPIVEISEDVDQNPAATCQPENEEKMSVEDSNITELQGNNIAPTVKKIEHSEKVIEHVMSKKVEQEAAQSSRS